MKPMSEVSEPSSDRRGVIGVIPRLGRVLMIRRADGIPKGGTWCFPGGHIEPGETPEQALEREMREELGLETSAQRCLGWIRIPEGYRLEVFLTSCPDPQLRPSPAEIAEVRWVLPEDIITLEPGLPSNAKVLAMLSNHPWPGQAAVSRESRLRGDSIR